MSSSAVQMQVATCTCIAHCKCRLIVCNASKGRTEGRTCRAAERLKPGRRAGRRAKRRAGRRTAGQGKIFHFGRLNLYETPPAGPSLRFGACSTPCRSDTSTCVKSALLLADPFRILFVCTLRRATVQPQHFAPEARQNIDLLRGR